MCFKSGEGGSRSDVEGKGIPYFCSNRRGAYFRLGGGGGGGAALKPLSAWGVNLKPEALALAFWRSSRACSSENFESYAL